MNTIKQFTDTIIADFRRTSPMRFLSRRHVYSIAKDIMRNFFQQSLSNGRLYRDVSSHTDIKCVEMERISSVTCPIKDFKDCEIVMRTKHRLPDIISGGRGEAIIGVYTVDYGEELYRLTTLKNSLNKRRRNMSSTQAMEYIYLDGYIYVRDHYVEALNIILVTVDSIAAEKIDCSNDCDECKPYYEYKMIDMDKTTLNLAAMVKQSLMQDYMAIPPTRTEDKEKGIA